MGAWTWALSEQVGNATLEISGHQYFMPLELSLFLCKLLRLPDGQGLAASSITGLFLPETSLAARAPAGWPQLWSPLLLPLQGGPQSCPEHWGMQRRQRPDDHAGGPTDERLQ